MYCNYCGKVIQDDANLCAYCGCRVGAVAARKQLLRSRTDRKIAGVCAGLAEYFDLDVTLMRVIWVVLTFVGPPMLLAYIILWIVMPEEPLRTGDAVGVVVPGSGSGVGPQNATSV